MVDHHILLLVLNLELTDDVDQLLISDASLLCLLPLLRQGHLQSGNLVVELVEAGLQLLDGLLLVLRVSLLIL